MLGFILNGIKNKRSGRYYSKYKYDYKRGYARENKIPMFGICLGMQMAVVEFARHVAGLEGANSTEFVPDGPYSVIDIMDDQKDITEKGGTMRLGLYPCKLAPDSKCASIYNDSLIYERHRHRWVQDRDAARRMRENQEKYIPGDANEKLLAFLESHFAKS